MKRKLTYKTRLRILIAGSIVFLLIVYNLAIKSTIESVSACKNMEEKIGLIDEAPLKISLLKSQLESINGIIDNRDTTEDSEIREALLGKVGAYCNKNYTSLTELSNPIYSQFKDFQIETNIFTIEGSFKKLLSFAYLLEQKHRIGKLISIDFYSEEDYRTKEKKLYMTLYIQNLKNILKDEKN